MSRTLTSISESTSGEITLCLRAESQPGSSSPHVGDLNGGWGVRDAGFLPLLADLPVLGPESQSRKNH